MFRFLKEYILTIVFCILVISFYIFIGVSKNAGLILDKNEYYVKDIIDGDTITVEKESEVYSIRLLGINTPETAHPDFGKFETECYGEEAKIYTNFLLYNKKVELIKDGLDKDVYGRLLRYVYLDGNNINIEIIKNGYAKLYGSVKNQTILLKFKEAQNYAKNNDLGIWGNCN